MAAVLQFGLVAIRAVEYIGSRPLRVHAVGDGISSAIAGARQFTTTSPSLAATFVDQLGIRT